MIALVKDIYRSYFQMIIYSLGLYDDDMAKIVHQRKESCSNCPLHHKGWCSKKKAVNVISYPYKSVFKSSPTKMIFGCSCWIRAKKFSIAKKNPCPLMRWKQFKNK